MITGFNASSTDVDTQLKAFIIAAHGNRSDAIQSAAARFIRGEVEGHKRNRCPTVAEFAAECRSEHSRFRVKDRPKPIAYQAVSRPWKDWSIAQRQRTEELAAEGYVLLAKGVTHEQSRSSGKWPVGTIWFWAIQEAWGPRT